MGVISLTSVKKVSKMAMNEDRWHSLQFVIVKYNDKISSFSTLQKVGEKYRWFPTMKERG